MGGDGKEESGFGFKDRAKAQETLRLLEQHEPQYRRLTVRGLLGRARRVLSLTKAEDKIKNIKEAMAVFEEWIEQEKDSKSADNKDAAKKDKDSKCADDKDAAKKKDKKEEKAEKKSSGEEDEVEKTPEKQAEGVPGLGFKDAAAARGTIQALEGRDPDYQKLAVRGLVGRAERLLTITRDDTKKKNITEAVEILQQYLEAWESEGRGAENLAYLPLPVVEACLQLARARGVAPADSDSVALFVSAYREARGNYKHLRTVSSPDSRTWDIVRNATLRDLKRDLAPAELMDASGEPTAAHLQMALWAYSPLPARLKALTAALPAVRDTRKRSSSTRERDSASPAKKPKS